MASAALSFQNVPPAPGRQQQSEQKVQSATQAQGSPDSPQGESPGGLGLLFPLLLLVPLLLLMFFSGRSQQKKQQQMLASLKKGDRIVTQSGLVGKLVDLGDRYAKMEIAPGVKVDVVKSGLLGKDSVETAQAVEKKK